MKYSKHIFVTLLVAAGITLMSHGFYIKAKAKLADWLLAHSWQQRSESSVPQKPWPWADTYVIGKITIPRLGIQHFVMHDASGESLAFGLGAVLPLQAQGYNFIAGHRDTHLSFLDQLQNGDKVQLETYNGEKLSYTIDHSQVLDTRNGPMSIDTDADKLTLITCWPMDSVVPGGPLRYAVEGSLTI